MSIALIGPVLGALVGFLLGRLTDVPATIRRNDERIRNRDEDLLTWVMDDDRDLEREVSAKQQAAYAAGVVSTGIHFQIRDRVTAVFEHRYRDQLRDAERVTRDVRLSEGAIHRAYRKLWNRPYPVLKAPREAEIIVARWKARRSTASSGLRSFDRSQVGSFSTPTDVPLPC